MRPRLLVTIALLVLVLIVVVRCAWVGDDAFITLRVVDNALSGHGLRWNVADRVQAYTHPLWLLLLLPAHALTGEAYVATLGLSLGVSLLALLTLVAQTDRGWGSAIALVAIGSSKASIDYATSGLENPLTHLFVGLLALLLLRRPPSPARLAGVTALTALLGLCRLDALLLGAPAWAWCVWSHRSDGDRRRLVAAALVPWAPLIVWLLFSVIYYGFPLPNTAYAKLGHGIARSELVVQGLNYVTHVGRHDPVTLLLVVAAPLAAWRLAARDAWALAVGPLAYVVYVIAVGGDFMAGRFLSAPAFVGAALVAALPWTPASAIMPAIATAILGALMPSAPVRSGRDYERLAPWKGIVDERGYYHEAAGLLGPVPGAARPDHSWVREGRKVREQGIVHPPPRACVGFFGYFAGPEVHVLERLALTDPLLARLPAEYDPSWRIGHFRRGIPAGYATAAPPEDPVLAAAADRVRQVTRGDLFDPGRWRAIWQLNTSGLGIEPHAYRFHGIVDATLTGKRVRVPERGLRVALSGSAAEITVGAGRGGLRAVMARGLQPLAEHDLPALAGRRAAAPLPTHPDADGLLLFPLGTHRSTISRVLAQ